MKFEIHDRGRQAFDRRARETHHAALQGLSPRVRAQLRLRTRQAMAGIAPVHAATATARPPRWGWIAAPALALALAFALPWPGSHDTTNPASTPIAAVPAATPPATTAPVVQVAAPLEQDPDFYLWLATADAIALAGDRP